MRNEMELQQIIYNLLETQITFGAYRCKDLLPTIKEASSYFHVSIDTIRLAYVRLKQQGYISLTTGVGAAVSVDFSREEIQSHIQNYFSCRKGPLLSFSKSAGHLFNYFQWFALKSAAPETLDELTAICFQKEIPPVFRMSRQIQLLYGTLGSDMLLSLAWQMFLYFQAPFVSIPQHSSLFQGENSPLPAMIDMVRQGDWAALWKTGEENADRYSSALDNFLKTSIPPALEEEEPAAFTWSMYKKSSQICYSLCSEFMTGIREGLYPFGSYLPSPRSLAEHYQIGLNTVRRSIAVLNKLGAVRSVNGIGTKVLYPWENAQSCDISDPTIRKRLLDFLQSFYILALSCRACSKAAMESMNEDALNRFKKRLLDAKQAGRYENMIYICHEVISVHAPWQAIRTIYRGLIQQLYWGLPLRNLHGNQHRTNTYFLPYLETLLDYLRRFDADGFSITFEQLQIRETACVKMHLLDLGIAEAAAVVIPEDKSDFPLYR